MKKSIAILAAVTVVAAVEASPLCRIGTDTYESLQAAFDATEWRTCTITLLDDVIVTETIQIPQIGSGNVCTLDGAGHRIVQGAKVGMFRNKTCFANVTFRDVTILGGGEDMSTVGDSDAGVGTLFYGVSDASWITFDSGCIVSNFVVRGPLIYAAQMNFVVNDGAKIACNRALGDQAYSGGVFKFTGGSGTLTVNGGEISDNEGSFGSVALALDGTPLITINGGVICRNKSRSDSVTGGTINLYGGAGKCVMNGGLITENSGPARDWYGTGGSAHCGIVLGDTEQAIFEFNGGAITRNRGDGVFIALNLPKVKIRGNGILAGNDAPGILHCNGDNGKNRLFLAGNFTGYVDVHGYDNSSWCAIGKEVLSVGKDDEGTYYSGSENIHFYEKQAWIAVTDEDTGIACWRDPEEATFNGTNCAYLDWAFSLVDEGKTVTLLRDCVLDGTDNRKAPILPQSRKFLVDGKGHRVFRASLNEIFNLVRDGASNITFTNIVFCGGYSTSAKTRTGDEICGTAVNIENASSVTFLSDVEFRDFGGTNAIVSLAPGSTVRLDGVTISDNPAKAIEADVGNVQLCGQTRIQGNASGDIDVADGNVLRLVGDLTGSVHVTVCGEEPFDGQWFGVTDGIYGGVENFINPGTERLHVSSLGGRLSWYRKGFLLFLR